MRRPDRRQLDRTAGAGARQPTAQGLSPGRAARPAPSPSVAKSAHAHRRWPPVVAVVALLGCGGSYDALARGDAALRSGRHDEAIAACDEAAASASDGALRGQAETCAAEARRRAAWGLVAEADAALAAYDLAGAGAALRRARAYAPADAKVIAALSSLLRLRTELEQRAERSAAEHARLRAAAGSADLAAWRTLCQELHQLQPWQRDYPAVRQHWEEARRTFAVLLVAAAREAHAGGDGERAAALAAEALRYDPARSEASDLRDEIATRGDAAGLVEGARRLDATGDLAAAVAAWRRAVDAAPTDAAAVAGYDRARDAWVAAHVPAIRKAQRERRKRDAILLARQAAEHGAADPALAKALAALYDKVHREAIATFRDRAARLERKGHDGAAMVAWRTAVALGDTDARTALRLEAVLRRLDAARRYPVAIEATKAPRGTERAIVDGLRDALRARLGDRTLAEAAVDPVDGPAAKGALGRLLPELTRVAIGRSDRDDGRAKKILDHVAHPANPAWQEAQSRQSSALAALNAARDRLRPLQARAEDWETKAAEHDAALARLRKQVAQDNADHYQGRRGPCPDGGTNCPESFGHQRWRSQIDHHEQGLRLVQDGLRELAPALDQARAAVARTQAAFDAAERQARETPRQLREEVWRDHAYTVRLYELRVDVEAALTWRDATTRSEAARVVATVQETVVDYATPEIVVKGQLVEAARGARLPDDAAVHARVLRDVVDQWMTQLGPALAGHARRLGQRADAAKSTDERLHWQVLALGVSQGIAQDRRMILEDAVLQATGYDWQRLAVDLARIPY